jgi:hypothetical protein
MHYLNYFVPIAQQTGKAAVLSRLSLSVCLVIILYSFRPSARLAYSKILPTY